MTQIFGADSRMPANTRLTNGYMLYDWVMRMGCFPSFWGRSLTGDKTITKEEIDFLHNKHCKVAFILRDLKEEEISINEVVEGNLLSAGKDHYYKISFGGSGEMKFRLQLSDNAKYNMYIYDADNTSIHIAHMGGAAGNTRLITRLVENKTYFIRIYAPDDNSIDATTEVGYSLQLIPIVATDFNVKLSKTLIRDNEITSISYHTIPDNAYTELSIYTDNSYLVLDGLNITARKNCSGNVTIHDTISELSMTCNVKAAIRLKDKYYIGQWIEPWLNMQMGIDSDGNIVTVGYSGCGLCCIAMGLLYEDFRDEVTSDNKFEAVKKIVIAGFQNENGLMYRANQTKIVPFYENTYAVSIEQENDFEACVNSGNLTMVRIFFPYINSEGKTVYTSHFVLIDGIDINFENETVDSSDYLKKFLVVDPNNGVSRSLYDAVDRKLKDKKVNSTPNISHLDNIWHRKLTITKVE